MVELTREMVASATKVAVETATRLNVCGKNLTDVRVSTLQWTIMNNLSSLSFLEGLQKLEELYLRSNVISTVNELAYLSACPALRVISLTGNPVADDPNYRSIVVQLVPSLEILDNAEVTEEERKAAESSGILLPKLLRRKRSGADAHGSSPVGARAADANSDAGSSTASPTAAGCGQSPKGRGSGKRHSASEDIVTGIFYLLRTLDAEGLGVIEKEARRLRRVREETARRR